LDGHIWAQIDYPTLILAVPTRSAQPRRHRSAAWSQKVRLEPDKDNPPGADYIELATAGNLRRGASCTGRLFATAIGKIGGSEATPLPVPLLHRGHELARAAAAMALGALGPLAAAAVPDLDRAIRSGVRAGKLRGSAKSTSWQRSAFVRSCISALGRIGPAARQAVPTLARLLEHHSYGLRAACADTLGALGPVARLAVPAMLRALEKAPGDCAGRLRSVLITTLVRLGVPRARVKLVASASASRCGG
jgi:HEAT repeat protein